MITTLTTPTNTTHQTHGQRLRCVIKRLVIDLGYIEHCLATEPQDDTLSTAASSIDSAISALHQHLKE